VHRALWRSGQYASIYAALAAALEEMHKRSDDRVRLVVLPLRCTKLSEIRNGAVSLLRLTETAPILM
jgi:hypothetical protein